jgi:hypothetical protein
LLKISSQKIRLIFPQNVKYLKFRDITIVEGGPLYCTGEKKNKEVSQEKEQEKIRKLRK